MNTGLENGLHENPDPSESSRITAKSLQSGGVSSTYIQQSDGTDLDQPFGVSGINQETVSLKCLHDLSMSIMGNRIRKTVTDASGELIATNAGQISNQAHYDGPIEQFLDGDIPPSVPTDAFFKFEITTMTAFSSTPFEIGNDLVSFLHKQTIVSLTKVKRPKFSITADVFGGGSMCTLKIRIYSQVTGRFAIEFQRRSGDSVLFNNTFRKVSRYLASHRSYIHQSQHHDRGPLQCPSLCTNPHIDDKQLQPQTIKERPPRNAAALAGSGKHAQLI